jgi:hypothetical protein
MWLTTAEFRVLYGRYSVCDRSGELQTGQGVVRIR